MSFLRIDLGTSFIKGAGLDLETRQLGHVRRIPFPAQVENVGPSHCEFDAGAIVAAVRTLIEELAPRAPDCEGLVMCSQMHGLVLMNDHGEARSNCVSWRDLRTVATHP